LNSDSRPGGSRRARPGDLVWNGRLDEFYLRAVTEIRGSARISACWVKGISAFTKLPSGCLALSGAKRGSALPSMKSFRPPPECGDQQCCQSVRSPYHSTRDYLHEIANSFRFQKTRRRSVSCNQDPRRRRQHKFKKYRTSSCRSAFFTCVTGVSGSGKSTLGSRLCCTGICCAPRDHPSRSGKPGAACKSNSAGTHTNRRCP